MDYAHLTTYISLLKEKLVHRHLSKFVQHDVNLFSCKVDNRESLIFALPHGDPRIYVGKTLLESQSMSGTLSSLLRKNFSNALVKDVNLVNEDRIVKIELSTINEVFKPETAYFVIELLPNRPNFIILDQDEKIVFAMKMTTLDDARPVVKGMRYAPVDKGDREVPSPLPVDEEAYLEECLKKEEALIESKKKRRYSPLFIKAKNLKKSAKRKYNKILEDIEQAKKNLEDANIGTLLLTYADQLDCRSGNVDIDGFVIEVDPRLTPAKNAEMYFKRYKKAKAAIAKSEENLARAEREIEEAESLELALDYGDDEILEEMLVASQSKGKTKSVQPSPYLPFQILLGNKRVLFGKNATQNDFLSFHFVTNKEFYWFHCKTSSGAHLIFEEENPTNKELEFCCQLALLASNLEQGEVIYCKKKQIRKGKAKGQAILSQYQSAYIRQVSPEAKKAFAGLTRLKKD